MNVVGIIAEYNPFHRGHEYQIQKLKERCSAEYAIIVMSGNFVQRGAPALMDKYSRAQMALSCGADLVLELPALFATASAEYFSRGGISLLNAAGVVTHLGFGTETDNLELLSELAAVLCEEPEPFREYLHSELKSGSTFPAARSAALQHYMANYQSAAMEQYDTNPATLHQHDANPAVLQHSFPAFHEIKKILASPNNILALEYLQSLAVSQSAMIPVPILRQGGGYHDTDIERDFCSASAIRSCLKNSAYTDKTAHNGQTADTRQTADNSIENGSSFLPETAMPKASFDIIKTYPHPFLFEDDLSALLHYELLTDDTERLAAWGDSSLELARRLLAKRNHFTNWSSFCQHMKTKNITYARLSRLFTHMLLHIRQEDYQRFSVPSYLRILGFRKAAAPLLSSIKSNSSLPLITSPADAERLLPPEAKQLLALDLRATELYRLCLTAKGDCALKNDFKQQIICL